MAWGLLWCASMPTPTRIPILFALFVWWFSTGAILYLVRLGPRARPLTLAGASVVASARPAIAASRNEVGCAEHA